MPIVFVKPILDLSMRKLCTKPYYNHKKGCPNYGKRDTCPPKAPILYDYFDMSKPILAVWTAFNLAAHRESMRDKHPNWSRRQLDCCLYWQGRVNKNLRRNNLQRHTIFSHNNPLIATYIPEAMGVNVTATMAAVDLILEWPPERTVIKVAFVGAKRANA